MTVDELSHEQAIAQAWITLILNVFLRAKRDIDSKCVPETHKHTAQALFDDPVALEWLDYATWLVSGERR